MKIKLKISGKSWNATSASDFYLFCGIQFDSKHSRKTPSVRSHLSQCGYRWRLNGWCKMYTPSRNSLCGLDCVYFGRQYKLIMLMLLCLKCIILLSHRYLTKPISRCFGKWNEVILHDTENMRHIVFSAISESQIFAVNKLEIYISFSHWHWSFVVVVIFLSPFFLIRN